MTFESQPSRIGEGRELLCLDGNTSALYVCMNCTEQVSVVQVVERKYSSTNISNVAAKSVGEQLI